MSGWKNKPLLLRLQVMVSSLLMLSACTSIPQSAMPVSHFSSLGCRELDNEQAMARESGRVASGAKSDAWKIIFPIAIAARYSNASSALNEAESRMIKLGAEQHSKGCAPSGA